MSQVEDTPGHHHVDGQTVFEPAGILQLSVFDTAAALESAVKGNFWRRIEVRPLGENRQSPQGGGT